MLCYRCGGHVKDGAGRCVTCGQQFDPALKAGPAAGFGIGVRRPRTVEGAPCQPGEKIAGRYEVREHAASGPLGWMYRAWEATNAGDVALKILSARFLQMPEEKRVFVEELHKAQRLSHPNIARIYEAGEDNGRPFVAAQYLEGLTLRRIMDLRRQKAQKFTLQEVEPIVAQIAAALDAAIGSFAHGDLKPDNVIVLPDLLKLTDFGLAVSLPRAPFMAAQKAAGTHRSLAPEFLLGEPLDARTDVFSLGAMLGEMLSGAQFEPTLSLLEKNPELPESVEALFRRAVSPRPGARFPSAGEMAAELSDIVAARPSTPPRALTEDAGDVVIVEAHTDPRLRIARALGATRAPDPAVTPAPAVAAPGPVVTVMPAPLEPAAMAALSALPLPTEPFTPPPPYEPPAYVPLPIEPPVAESGTPGVGTCPRVDHAAPAQADPKPRRGVGKRGREKLKPRGRRSMPLPDSAWTTSAPPTEGGALAIGPTTPALRPLQPEARPIETPAPVKRPYAPVSFGALKERPRSKAPLYAVGAIALLVVAGGGWSLLSARSAAATPDAAKPAEPVKAPPPPPKAEPAPVAPKKAPQIAEPKHSMRDRVRSVKERVEKALEERKRQREEALALANTRRAEQKAAEKEGQFAEQVIHPGEAPAKAAPPPPAGAISGLRDGDVLVAKENGHKVAAVNAAFTTAAAARDFACPRGMQKVAGGVASVGSDASDDLRNFGDRALAKVDLKPYCIDQYEFPNEPGKLPKVAATFADAEALCNKAGKRLCSEDEWEAACRGPQNLRFPYGTRFDPDACNTADAKDNPRQTNVAGAFSRCKSGYGVFDLSGNAAEWTATAFDGAGPDKTVKGGHAARPRFDDRCASRRKLSPGAHSINVGFRCCADGR